MDRVILHSDLNNFFASVECLEHPEWSNVPFAVSGSIEKRHGIILAKNEAAKKYGISTGEAIWTAKQKCPHLITHLPNYDKYISISRKVKSIYSEYSDFVESFGIDECWLDISPIAKDAKDGRLIADEIRRKIRKEIGVTVSVGVSFNKIFAKLASDIKKPDATTVIDRCDYKDIVWKLPASELLFVGRSTQKALRNMNIKTIGDIARTDPKILEFVLGKSGYTLWLFANGLDNSPVLSECELPRAQSIGNSVTPPRDLTSDNDISIILYYLCDTVSERMREGGYMCNTVQISIRNTALQTYERQEKLPFPSRTSRMLYETAYSLFKLNHTAQDAVRSLGVRACDLQDEGTGQLSFCFDTIDIGDMEKCERLERVSDGIRERFGSNALKRGIMLTDPYLCSGNIRGSGTSFEH